MRRRRDDMSGRRSADGGDGHLWFLALTQLVSTHPIRKCPRIACLTAHMSNRSLNWKVHFETNWMKNGTIHFALRRDLRLAVLRVPMVFEIGDQRRAEMAIGLLAGIDRHVVAKHIERFLRDADGAAVAGCAHYA